MAAASSFAAIPLLCIAGCLALVVAAIVIGIYAGGAVGGHDDDGNTGPSTSPPTATSPPSNGPVGDSGGFNIQLRYISQVSPEISQIFESAKNKWQSVITKDTATTASVQRNQELCGLRAPQDEVIDDLLIYVKVQNIDGPGQVLANAGPCAMDQAGMIRVGIMNFDLSDLNNLIRDETAGIVVLHEMGHVLGLGSLWEAKDLIEDHGILSKTYTYTGAQGNIGNQEVGAQGEAIVEETGGEGTAKSHWKETVYHNELMTGYVPRAGVAAPMSRLTVRALADLGYQVDVNQADPYKVGETSLRGAAGNEDRISYGDDVLKFDLTIVETKPKERR